MNQRIRSDRIKNTYKLICKACHSEFISNSRHTKFCSDTCRQYMTHKIRAQQAYQELNKVLKEVEAYNKAHNTKLSYGQYVAGRRC